jgi:hypothetical protein
MAAIARASTTARGMKRTSTCIHSGIPPGAPQWDRTGASCLMSASSRAAQMASEDAPPATARLATDFEGWAWESNGIARSFVYRDLTPTESLKYCRLSSGYVMAANRIARQRLVLAAYRLAALLNATLGAAQPVAVPRSWPAGPASSSYDPNW